MFNISSIKVWNINLTTIDHTSVSSVPMQQNEQKIKKNGFLLLGQNGKIPKQLGFWAFFSTTWGRPYSLSAALRPIRSLTPAIAARYAGVAVSGPAYARHTAGSGGWLLAAGHAPLSPIRPRDYPLDSPVKASDERERAFDCGALLSWNDCE